MSGTICDTAAWKSLEAHASTFTTKHHLRDLLQDKQRSDITACTHNGIFLDYSRQLVNAETLDLLFEVAKAAELSKKISDMHKGVHLNVSEDRSVLHFALRASKDTPLIVDGANVTSQVHDVLSQIEKFSNDVRNGKWVGCTGKPLTHVISVGIGGSYLGPEFVFEALKNDSTSSAAAEGRGLRFLANVDPVDVARATAGLDPETTLVCVVSKTFTTAETMLNAKTLREWLVKSIHAKHPGVSKESVVRQHMVAVSTAVSKVTEFGIDPANIFQFWDWVGGRYSVCSAVGVLPLSLHYGYYIVEQFLSGARDVDDHFFTAPLHSNLPVIMGLMGVWNSSFLQYNTRAVLPYTQALVRFAAHIQQLEMESNGKQVLLNGQKCPMRTGEVIFGEPGTNGQHSFYQLIHQGTSVTPCEFIGFCRSQSPIHLTAEGSAANVSNHDELMSNFFAQPDALAVGKSVDDLKKEGVTGDLLGHKHFPGNRPSLSLLFDQLTPFSCGQLLALYENRVAVQGFIWGINSFDQWGVELGKVLAVQVRSALSEVNNGNGTASLAKFNPSTAKMLSHYVATK